MKENRPEISVVILCYRSGDFASVFCRQMSQVLDREKLNYEIVLVGNYNEGQRGIDKTPEVVLAIESQNKRVKAVALKKEGMMGWDMRSGLNMADGETVAVIDGDGQMPAEDIIKVYHALISGKYEIGKTYRDTRFDGPWRVFISRVYNFFLKFMFPKVKVNDVNSKPKIFRREALRKLALCSDDWFIDAEIIIKGTYLGMNIVETPTEFHPNENRPSFINSIAILEFIKNLFVYRARLFLGRLL